MEKAETRAGPATGTAQGVVQALIAVLFMLVGAGNRLFSDPGAARGPAFWIAISFVSVALVGLGIVIDRRRAERPLALVAPVFARRAVLLLAVGLPMIVTCALALIEARTRAEALEAFVCTFLGGMLVGVPCIWIPADRILGPAWVLTQSSIRALGRRRWPRYEVLEVDGERAVIADASRERMSVRTEHAMQPGPAHIVLRPLPMPAEPYREDALRGIVEQIETEEERGRRTRDIVTAGLALASGLAWLSPPFAAMLGAHLTR